MNTKTTATTTKKASKRAIINQVVKPTVAVGAGTTAGMASLATGFEVGLAVSGGVRTGAVFAAIGLGPIATAAVVGLTAYKLAKIAMRK